MAHLHLLWSSSHYGIWMDMDQYKPQRGDRTETWSECRTGSENVNNRLASNKCDNSQSFLIKIFFERFWKVGLKANIDHLIHNYK